MTLGLKCEWLLARSHHWTAESSSHTHQEQYCSCPWNFTVSFLDLKCYPVPILFKHIWRFQILFIVDWRADKVSVPFSFLFFDHLENMLDKQNHCRIIVKSSALQTEGVLPAYATPFCSRALEGKKTFFLQYFSCNK